MASPIPVTVVSPPCTGPGDEVEVQVVDIPGDFEEALRMINPDLWSANLSVLFDESIGLRYGRVSSPSPSVEFWTGLLYEQVSIGLLTGTLRNALEIQWTVTGSAPNRLSTLDYSLDRSLDGRISVDEGHVVIQESTAGLTINFSKALLSDYFAVDYCTRMEAFLTIGIRAIALQLAP